MSSHPFLDGHFAGLLERFPKSRRSAMSPSLLPELLDLVIDHLHNDPDTLKTCCIVPKSCVTPARRHLFAHVEFDALNSDLEVWKKTFPDPSNSPARYTRSLFIHSNHDITAADTAAGGWVRTFQNVTHLQLMRLNRASLIPFHGISLTLRSLDLTYLTAEAFDLVCSFPLLEDLSLSTLYPESDSHRWNPPPTSPKLTGSLRLWMQGRTRPVARRLLELPDGLRFKNLNVSIFGDDIRSVEDLVSACSETLEHLTILYSPLSAFPSTPVTSQHLTIPDTDVPRVVFLDISKAKKLKHLTFSRSRSSRSTVQWITMTLQTVDSKNLQSITIKPHDRPPETIEEDVYQEWQDLDRVLVQFWTSRSIRPRVVYMPRLGEGKDLGVDVPILLPELTRRGLVDLVKLPLESFYMYGHFFSACDLRC